MSQKYGYVNNWSSGYGFEEIRNHLIDNGKGKQIIVGVRLDAGIPESAVFTYFNKSESIHPTYFDSRLVDNIDQYDCLESSVPFYFVSRDQHLVGLDKYLVEEKRVY